ncbi:MAG TPA: hypothetical protein ENK18_13865 [Deltaproteobacteria bacterium]|nr:hypothetical protein [Deltaproteobacteria bacterium]
MTLELEPVLLVTGSLLLLVGWLATYRPDARQIGVVAGLIVTVGGATAWLLGATSPVLLLDDVSLPRMPLIGIGLVGIFAVMPRRHARVGTMAVLIALALVDLALSAVPSRELSGPLWVLSTLLTWLALPSGPPRQIAWPYLALAAGTGLAGTFLGGSAGAGLLVFAVVIRLGIFPFHSWIISAYTLAPTTIAVALAAPMSCIALVARHPMSFDVSVAQALTAYLATAALIGGGLAVVQRYLARSVAFFTVGVQALVLLGVLDADHIGHLGGLIMWTLTGLALTGVGLVAAALRSRTGGIRIDSYAGLIGSAPTFGTLFLLFGLAAVGAPGTADFASEDLVLHGGLAHHAGLLLLYIAAVSVHGYVVLHLFYKVFFGPPRKISLRDALPREWMVLVAMGALLVLAGLAPQLLLDGWLPMIEPLAVGP